MRMTPRATMPVFLNKSHTSHLAAPPSAYGPSRRSEKVSKHLHKQELGSLNMPGDRLILGIGLSTWRRPTKKSSIERFRCDTIYETGDGLMCSQAQSRLAAMA